nr:(d)CMP kinase [Anaerolineae bacterium]
MGEVSTIAIDGPAAAGKTTLALRLASRLDYLYFDTGVMYRAVTLAALEREIDLNDEEIMAQVARQISINVVPPTVDDGRPCTVYLDGRDVTWAIREPQIDANVSLPSTYAEVRSEMTRQQRRIAERGRVVMVGRDIGTVVLPEADLKIYLDASAEARAVRRLRDYQDNGQDASYNDILASMHARDRLDSQRDVAPLKPADDAVIIDCTTLTVEEVLDRVMQLIDQQEMDAQ